MRSQVGYRVSRWRVAHTCVVVRRVADGAGFAYFGEVRAAAHFAPRYLGGSEAGGWRCERVGVWPWVGRARLARGLARRYGLVVFERTPPPPGLKGETFLLPTMVEMTASLPATFAEFLAGLPSSAKADLRKHKRRGWTISVGRDPAGVADFHRDYYVPSMRSRYGEDAYVFGSSVLEDCLTRKGGEFIGVHEGDRLIAGLFCRPEERGSSLRFAQLAWLGGDEALYRSGVIGQLYVAAIERAFFHGARKVNFGPVSPYLEDGLMAYKTKWGGRLRAETSFHEDRAVLLDPRVGVCREFLDTHSLLLKAPGGERFAAFMGGKVVAERMAEIQADALDGRWRLVDSADEAGEGPGWLPAGFARWYRPV